MIIETSIVIMSFIVAGFFFTTVIAFGVSVHNSLLRLRRLIEQTKTHLDSLFTRRSKEIAELLSLVKRYLPEEHELLAKLTLAQANLLQAVNMGEKAKIDNLLRQTLGNLLASCNRHPALKVEEQFQRLLRRIAVIEGELANWRQFYNASVAAYNSHLQSFPNLLIAKALGYTLPETQFAVEDDNLPPKNQPKKDR